MGKPAINDAEKEQPIPWSAEAKVLCWLAERFPKINWRLMRHVAATAENIANSLSASSSAWTWPILDSLGQCQGVLHGSSNSATATLTNYDQSIVERAIFLWGDLLRIEHERNYASERAARAEELALVDALTGLPNRRAWEQALAREEQRCRRANHPAAIICMDLDRLKEQNDSAGHAAGDELLQKAADCLRRAIRPHDLAARLGGDEFGILLVECAGECMPTIIERLRAALAAADVSATLGWAARANGNDLHEAWRAADQALITAK